MKLNFLIFPIIKFLFTFSLYFLFCFQPVLQGYVKSHLIDSQMWKELEPYFLPESHSIKPNLDKIFSKTHASSSQQALKEAHFSFKTGKTPQSIIVAKHSKLKGYIVKLFTDDQGVHQEWMEWLKRIHGAQIVRQAIARHQLEHLFKVPKKWIYPLPIYNAASEHQNYFVLIVEDMHILKESQNLFFWRSVAVDHQLLDSLYILLQEEGLFDSMYPDNIPFCKDRKVAFIDTQHVHGWPVRFDRLTPYLRKEMQQYWQQLTDIKEKGL